MSFIWCAKYDFEDRVEVISFNFGDLFIDLDYILFSQLIENPNHEVIQDDG